MAYQSDPNTWNPSRVLAALGLKGGLIGGTTVLTQAGAIPVERLAVGQMVVTRTGISRIAGILSAPAHKAPLVRIEAGSDLVPLAGRDLVVHAGQPLYLRGQAAMNHTGRPEAIVRAGDLADGLSVFRCILPHADEMRLYRLVFDDAQIYFAGGADIGAPAPFSPLPSFPLAARRPARVR